MIKLISLFLFVFLSNASAQQSTGRVVTGDQFPGIDYNKNLVLNPDASNSKSLPPINVITSSDSLVNRNTTSTALFDGADFVLGSSSGSSSGNAMWSTMQTPVGLVGANCSFKFTYRTTGLANNIYTAEIRVSGSVVVSRVLPLAQNRAEIELNYPCSSSTTQVGFSYPSGTFNNLFVDNLYWGKATNISTATIITPWVRYTPTFTAFGTVTNIDFFSRRVGDSLEVRGRFTSGTVTASEARITLGFSGVNANVTQDSAKIVNNMIVGNYGTASASTTWFGSGSVLAVAGQNYLNFSPSSSTVSILQAANANIVTVNSVNLTFFAKVPIATWTEEQVFRPNTIAWKVDANISGANPSLGTASVSSYTGIENGSLTLTNNVGAGNIQAQIPCSSTNAPTGTTCAVGNESVGISFNLPVAGDVLACASFGSNAAVTSGTINQIFQIVETANNAQTILQEGKSRPSSTIPTSGFDIPWRICGNFSFSSAGQKTLRLMYEQQVTGTVIQSLVLADALAANGQRDIHWEVYPINQIVPAPLIANSVVTSNASPINIEFAVINGTSSVCSASPCTLDVKTPNITNITRSAVGTYSAVFPFGTFSTIPSCTVSSNNAILNCQGVAGTATTTTSYPFQCYNSTTGTATDSRFSVTCTGAK